MASGTIHANKNQLGTPIDISSYNSINNAFTIPSDGYVIAYRSYSSPGGFSSLIIQNGSPVINIAGQSTSSSTESIPCFVRAGMKTYCVSGLLLYVPFE